MEVPHMGEALKVLSAGAVRQGVSAVAQNFMRANATRVDIDFSSAPKVRARLIDGEPADVAIASTAALDALAQAAKIVTASRAVLGRSRMVVVMKKGGNAPDLSTPAAFEQALLEADMVLYNQGSSGIYAEALIDRLDLRGRLGSRIRVARNGAEMTEIITSHGGRALGLAQISNLLDQVEKGMAVELAGFFPDALQEPTTYEIAVSAASRRPGLADAFVKAFASAESRKLLAASGLD